MRVDSGKKFTTCACNHTTNFGLLMNVIEEKVILIVFYIICFTGLNE